MRGSLLLFLLLALPPLAVADEPAQPESEGPGDAGVDTDAKSGFIWVPPSGFYGNWVFLLEAYYSGLDGFGIGAQAQRPFTVPLLSGYADSDIEFQVSGRIYEDFHGSLRATVDATFDEMRWSVRGNFDHSTRLREFWGVGNDLPDSNREEYRPRNLRTYFECLRNIDRLRIGIRLEFQDYQYLELKDGGLLDTGDYVGVRSTGESAAGIGLTWDYDGRDDRYAPTRGWRIRGNVMGFDVYRKGESMFLNSNVDVRTYLSTSPRNVFAFQWFAFGVHGTAPLWRYAAIGGREHTRGYSRNRYLDQKMTAIQGEWRRHLYRRVGLQIFAGTALVAPSWRRARIRNQHPTIGAGLSVVIPQVSSLAIRGDLAFGDESVHARLDLGLAF